MKAIYSFLLLCFILSQSFSNKIRYLEGNTSNKQYLKKSQSVTVNAEDGFILFDTKDFKEGEEMYFKIKAINFYGNYVLYYFTDTDNGVDGLDNTRLSENVANFEVKIGSENIEGVNYKVRYFTIKKDKSKFYGTNGSLLFIVFYVDADDDGDFNNSNDGKVIIENTLEDEGKLETWVVVVIVIAAVLVIGVIIGCYCWRRKKQLAAQNDAYNGQPVGVNQNNIVQYQPGSNYNVNQPYTQVNPNYNTNQQFNQPFQGYGPNQQYN